MQEKQPFKILIVRLSSFGDIVHTLPAFAYLRKSLPDARVDWLVEEKFEPILRSVNGIDRLLEVDTVKWRKSLLSLMNLSEMKALRRTLRSERYDLAVDFQGLLKSALFTALSGARVKTGFARAFLKEPAAVVLYNRRMKPDTSKPSVILKNLSIAANVVRRLPDWFPGKVLNIKKAKPEAQPKGLFYKNRGVSVKVRQRLKKVGIKKFALIHTGSSHPNKLLPLETQAELCDLLWNDRHLQPVLFGSGADIENAIRIKKLCKASEPVIIKTTIQELIELIRLARVFIGPDSGPLHLAALIGARTVGYFGPTDPKRNAPLGRNVKIIQSPNPCRKPSCWKNCKDNKCLQSLLSQNNKISKNIVY